MLTFQDNWNNLVARKRAISNGTLTAKLKAELPLSPNFQKWANANWQNVRAQLTMIDGLTEIQEPLSHSDWANWRTQRTNQYFADNGLFPYSPQIDEYFWVQSGDMAKWLRKCDERIASWNPRVQPLNATPEMDEFGNLINPEYAIDPEIIGGGVGDTDNPQFLGIDENGDNTYRDFDEEGVFLPMGNPNNSTDYQDDFDPQDYQRESWNDVDNLDDLHHDYHYAETTVTEQPIFNEYGSVTWESEAHMHSNPPVQSEDDQAWVEDARNWMTRERLLQESANEEIREEVLSAYPVSQKFLNYLETEKHQLGNSKQSAAAVDRIAPSRRRHPRIRC